MADNKTKCPYCDGFGYAQYTESHYSSGDSRNPGRRWKTLDMRECSSCSGIGHVINKVHHFPHTQRQCSDCNGSGKIEQKKRIPSTFYPSGKVASDKEVSCFTKCISCNGSGKFVTEAFTQRSCSPDYSAVNGKPPYEGQIKRKKFECPFCYVWYDDHHNDNNNDYECVHCHGKGTLYFSLTFKNGQWIEDWITDSEKGFCFLTTAICFYKKLPDDCHELEVLRQFRDNYLLTTDDGRKMVEHYYLIAPVIAERLVEPSDLEQVWKTVTNCVNAIESGEHQKVVAMYKMMVFSLQKKLL